jgi:hypothetical protein
MSLENSEENPDSRGEQENPDDKQGKPEQQISAKSAEPGMPPSTTNGKESNRCKKHWIEYATFGVEVLGLIGLVIYALLTYGIYCASKNSADAAKSAANTAKNALEIQSRPWITVPDSLDVPSSNPKAGWPNLILNNYGSSPAIVMYPDQLVLSYVQKDEVRNWRYSLQFPDLCGLAEDRRKFPVFPKVPKLERFEAGHRDSKFNFPDDSLSGCLVYYSATGQGPYTTKFVYSLNYDSPAHRKITSITLNDIEIH